MPLESATYIPDLVAANPAHTDGLNQGDGHLRLIKSVLQNTFPNFSDVALNSSQAALDAAVNLLTGTSGVAAFPAGTVTAPTLAFTGDPDSGFYKQAEDTVGLALNGTLEVSFGTAGVTVTPPLTANNGLAVTGAISGGTGQLCPVGAILLYQGTAPPTGWAWCNGGTVLASSNPGLTAIYGSTGGNVTLPDWRAMFPIGKQDMGGTSRGVYTVGGFQANINIMNATVGEGLHTLSTGECPTGLFTYSFNDPGHSHIEQGNATPGGGSICTQVGSNLTPGANANVSSNTASATTGITSTLTDHGGNGAHNIMSFSIVTGFIIKLG